MRAVIVEGSGAEASVSVGEVAEPEVVRGSVRIRVAAAGLNRGDLMQRRGLYPAPPGASEIMGLECSGEVIEVGGGVEGFSVGDRVMALLPGGGYAEEAVADAGSVMHVPDVFSDVEAGVFPEVFLTVFSNVFQLGGLRDDGSVLVHGGGSGIGTATIALAKQAGATVFVTAGSKEKCDRCLELGADLAIDYNQQNFADEVARETDGRGVDVVLDSIGAAYLDTNLKCLALNGRLVVIGVMKGAKAEVNLGAMMMRRHSIIGSTLRSRHPEEKAKIVAGLRARFGTDIDAGRLRPVVHASFPLEQVAEAHALMQSSGHFGKIALEMR